MRPEKYGDCRKLQFFDSLKKSETAWFPTLNFEAFSISAILRILKLINASKTHFSINNSKSYYKMRKTLFFWFVQFHTVLEVYEPQTLV